MYNHKAVNSDTKKTNRQMAIGHLTRNLGTQTAEWKNHPNYTRELNIIHCNIYNGTGAAQPGLDNMVQSGVRIFNDATKEYSDRNSVDLAIEFYDEGAVSKTEFIDAVARKS